MVTHHSPRFPPAAATAAASLLAAALVMAGAQAARAAEPPAELAIQGVLTDATGAPITSAAVDVTARLFTVAVAGAAVYEETFLAANTQALTVNSGVYTINLGAGAGTVTTGSLPAAVNNAALWMELTVDADTAANPTLPSETLAPRTKLRSVAFALNATMLDGLDSADYLRATAASTLSSGTFTVGPAASLAVAGSWQVGGTIVTATANEINLLTGRTGTVWTSANDGAATGLDADLLDGQESAFYTNASNIAAGTLAAAFLPADGYAATYLNATGGDTVSGTLTFNASTLRLNDATNTFATTFTTAATAARTVTFPDATGTVALTTDLHAQNSDTGTTSATWLINSGGNSATLTTASLTSARAFTLPDAAGTLALTNAAQTIAGTFTFNASTLQVNNAANTFATTFATAATAARAVTFPDASGTVALTTDLHAQNTDTGTTSTTWLIN
ncbi:MAG: hypothetical protein HY719_05220, partial [Planctomycetes bacterium]|nr:hypothetical protein [Planctomycetota bacterium]